jgi:hypothetical protein
LFLAPFLAQSIARDSTAGFELRLLIKHGEETSPDENA